MTKIRDLHVELICTGSLCKKKIEFWDLQAKEGKKSEFHPIYALIPILIPWKLKLWDFFLSNISPIIAKSILENGIYFWIGALHIYKQYVPDLRNNDKLQNLLSAKSIKNPTCHIHHTMNLRNALIKTQKPVGDKF